MDETLKNTLILGGVGAGLLYFLKNNQPQTTQSGFVSSAVNKMPGDPIKISLNVTNGNNSIAQNYGIGLSLMDSKGVIWDVINATTMMRSPGTSIRSEYFTVGQTKTIDFGTTMGSGALYLPTDMSAGAVSVRASIWKESTLPLYNRLADTGWRTPADINIGTPAEYDIKITQVTVT